MYRIATVPSESFKLAAQHHAMSTRRQWIVHGVPGLIGLLAIAVERNSATVL
jgi:hypothetical protein